MTTKNVTSQAQWLALIRAKLSQRIALWVLISILIIEIIIVFPSYFVRQNELLDQLERSAEIIIQPMLNLMGTDQAETAALIIANLEQNTVVLGKAIYRADGTLIETFGEPPRLTPADLHGQQVARQLRANSTVYEVAWSSAYLNTPYICIVRLDASAVQAEMVAYTQRMIGFILLISAFVTAATMLAVSKTVIVPILQLRDSLLATGQAEADERLNLITVEQNDELGDVMTAFNKMACLIHKRTLRLRAEVEIAQELQKRILPTPQELQQIAWLDIAGFMQPADEVGGDYYDVLQCDNRIKIGIGDVTGHGLESGLLMLMTQTAVRTLLINKETDPVQFLNTLNRTLLANIQRLGTDKSLTLALLDYTPQDDHSGIIRLSGQHEELLVIRHDGTVQRIDTIDLGFPLGLDAEIEEFISHREVELRAGDGVVLYTDGITEAENYGGEHYGLERLCTVLQKSWAASADEIRNMVIKDVQQFIEQQKLFDDLTLVVVKQR